MDQAATTAFNDANAVAKVQEAVKACHQLLHHSPVDDDEDDDEENPSYSDQDMISALREAANHRLIKSLSRSLVNVPLGLACQAIIKHSIALHELSLSNSSAPTNFKNPDDEDSDGSSSDRGSRASFAQPNNNITYQAKAISAVKNQVDSLPDISHALALAKDAPEELLLFLSQLEKQLDNGEIDRSYWHLCLSYLSKDQPITSVLTSFASTDLLTNARPPWDQIKTKIIEEWASHWNRQLFFFKIIQRPQLHMKFTYFLMELKTRVALSGNEFLELPSEFLIALLRKEILEEIFQTNRRRLFTNMADLIQQVQAAINNKPSIDGTVTIYTASNFPQRGLPGRPPCSFCKTKFGVDLQHKTEDCRKKKAEESGGKVNEVVNSTQSPSSSFTDSVCYRCKKVGHIATYCTEQPTTTTNTIARKN